MNLVFHISEDGSEITTVLSVKFLKCFKLMNKQQSIGSSSQLEARDLLL